MSLAQGHNAVMPVRLKLTTPRSQVKHSTTEPLHSLQIHGNKWNFANRNLGMDMPLSAISDNQDTLTIVIQIDF